MPKGGLTGRGRTPRDRFVELTATVIDGLQVPASIGGAHILGTAYSAWVELRDLLGLFGWQHRDHGNETEKAIEKLLENA